MPKREGLGQVRRGNPLALRQIRDRARDAQGAVHRANGQAEARDGVFEEGEARVIERTMLLELPRGQVRVAESGGGRPSRRRAPARRGDAQPHGGGILAAPPPRELRPRNGRHGHVKVDAIEQRARRACARSAARSRGAQRARRGADRRETAGARIHRGDEEEVAREDARAAARGRRRRGAPRAAGGSPRGRRAGTRAARRGRGRRGGRARSRRAPGAAPPPTRPARRDPVVRRAEGRRREEARPGGQRARDRVDPA